MPGHGGAARERPSDAVRLLLLRPLQRRAVPPRRREVGDLLRVFRRSPRPRDRAAHRPGRRVREGLPGGGAPRPRGRGVRAGLLRVRDRERPGRHPPVLLGRLAHGRAAADLRPHRVRRGAGAPGGRRRRGGHREPLRAHRGRRVLVHAERLRGGDPRQPPSGVVVGRALRAAPLLPRHRLRRELRGVVGRTAAQALRSAGARDRLLRRRAGERRRRGARALRARAGAGPGPRGAGARARRAACRDGAVPRQGGRAGGGARRGPGVLVLPRRRPGVPSDPEGGPRGEPSRRHPHAIVRSGEAPGPRCLGGRGPIGGPTGLPRAVPAVDGRPRSGAGDPRGAAGTQPRVGRSAAHQRRGPGLRSRTRLACRVHRLGPGPDVRPLGALPGRRRVDPAPRPVDPRGGGRRGSPDQGRLPGAERRHRGGQHYGPRAGDRRAGRPARSRRRPASARAVRGRRARAGGAGRRPGLQRRGQADARRHPRASPRSSPTGRPTCCSR